MGMVVGGALVAGGMALGGMSAQDDDVATFKTINAQEIHLTDRRGQKTFLTLRSSELGGHMILYDTQGREMMVFGVTRLPDPKPTNEEPLSPQPAPEPVFAGVADVRASDGTLLLRQGGALSGGDLTIHNRLGRDAVSIAAHESGNGLITVYDLGGQPVAEINGTTQGGLFQTKDRRGNVLGHLP